VATDPMAVGSRGHTFEMEDLAKAVREDRDPFITIESTMHAVETANAVNAAPPRCVPAGRAGRGWDE
jgi:hypothetical protein